MAEQSKKKDYTSIIEEGKQRYPNWQSDKAERYKLRGWLYGMNVPIQALPPELAYQKPNQHYLAEFQMGYQEGGSYRNEQNNKKLKEEYEKSGQDFQTWLDNFTKKQEELEAKRQEEYDKRQQEQEEKRWKSGNVSFQEVRNRLGPIRKGQAYVLDPDSGQWTIRSVNDLPETLSAGYTYSGKDLVSGLQYRDQFYSEYMKTRGNVLARVMDEMRKEQASARVRGVDYDFSEDRINARLAKYMPGYWTDEQTSRLKATFEDVGVPKGYGGELGSYQTTTTSSPTSPQANDQQLGSPSAQPTTTTTSTQPTTSSTSTLNPQEQTKAKANDFSFYMDYLNRMSKPRDIST